MVLRRRLLDLRAFRDDVYIAAWRPQEADGRIWEAFTLVWRGEARSAAALAEQLQGYRYYDEKAYANALAELVTRGWIKTDNGGFSATPQGHELRQRVEAETDRLFDAPWQVLSEGEIETLQELLGQLGEIVTPPPAGENEDTN
jgi:DNA-binding MarR family transcriptional regulator